MHKCFCLPSDSLSVLNGNHQSSTSNSDSKNNNNVAKKLQNSSLIKVSSSSSNKQSVYQPPPQNMLNGRNGSVKEDPIYENSNNFQNIGNKTPPVPPRSPINSLIPVPHPRTSLSVASSGPSGAQRSQESPKLLRNVRAEAKPGITPASRGSGQSKENSSLSHSHKSQFSSTAPSSPSRIRGSALQKRSPSPMREQQPPQADAPQRLRTQEPSGSPSLRELPPLGPYTSQRATPGSGGKNVPDSPQGPRKLAAPSKAESARAMYASPLTGLEKEPVGRQFRPSPGGSTTSGMGSLSASSPLASPRSQRKPGTGLSGKEQGLIKPYTRERKNSISEISDNEDELLEYHRWQREERLREQEMEKLVSDVQRRSLQKIPGAENQFTVGSVQIWY